MSYDRGQIKADRLAELRRHLIACPQKSSTKLKAIKSRGNESMHAALLRDLDNVDAWCDEEIARLERLNNGN